MFKEIIPILGTNFLSVSNKATERLYPSKLKSKVIILNNAIDIEKYSFNLKKREKLRKKFKIDENLKLIGAVGRFVQVKNYSFLVDVFNEISKKRKNEFKLMFIGEGELYREIREKVKKLDLEDKVLFIGQTDKVEDYYQMMDLFVMPSLYEGFPLVGVEAQANGLNCIFSETITNKINLIDNCTFAPLNKKEEWVDIILNMRINRKKKVIDILSNKGFNIKKNLELLERIYYEN